MKGNFGAKNLTQKKLFFYSKYAFSLQRFPSIPKIYCRSFRSTFQGLKNGINEIREIYFLPSIRNKISIIAINLRFLRRKNSQISINYYTAGEKKKKKKSEKNTQGDFEH